MMKAVVTGATGLVATNQTRVSLAWWPETVAINSADHPHGVSERVEEVSVREFGGMDIRCSCLDSPHPFGIEDQVCFSLLAMNQGLGWPTVVQGEGKQMREVLYRWALADHSTWTEPSLDR